MVAALNSLSFSILVYKKVTSRVTSVGLQEVISVSDTGWDLWYIFHEGLSSTGAEIFSVGLTMALTIGLHGRPTLQIIGRI